MFIIGISAYYHDSAACILYNDEIIAAAQEERFTRKKHDSSFPINALKYCLDEAGLNISDINHLVYYEKPFLKFERLLETYYNFAPRGFVSFITAIPVWIKEKLFIKEEIYQQLKKIGTYDRSKLKIYFSEHHLSHSASAYYPSGFSEAAILTIDGMGEWASASIAKATGANIEILKELYFPNSLGLLYSAFTFFTGFVVNSGEYKLMGLAPYGNPNDPQVEKFKNIIREHLVDIKEDGSLNLNMKYFAFATGLKMIHVSRWEKLFGLKLRRPDDKLTQEHCNLALAIQQITEEIIMLMAKQAKKLTDSDNLCLSGGVALNCVANSVILKSGVFKNIFVQPAAGDAGGALGAAFAFLYLHKKYPFSANGTEKMKGAFLGPSFSDNEVLKIARKYGANFKYFENRNELNSFVATQIANSKVVGWFNGRMEYGPRALGARSILADARDPEMQKKLNLKIKFREGFRPFAPSVIYEDTKDYFDIDIPSPYMLFTAPVKENLRNKLPENYNELDLKTKLYTIRSNVPAITHCDFSARLQTVHRETNPNYYALINEFKKITGTALIVNTSFNVRGEPIVCNPDDAFRCFMRTEMDILVMENFVFIKEEQNLDKSIFKENFKPD